MIDASAALILVDLQNDFCRGGSLAVPDADSIIDLANELQKYFSFIIATKDWHPSDHMSFAQNHPCKKPGDIIELNDIKQVLWPAHCVQNTTGSAFHPSLETFHVNRLFYKGIDKMVDSYSAFYDNAHLKETGLKDYLYENKVHSIYLMGLATDYCVKYSALDAVKLGFETYLIEDACRGVELQKGDIKKSLEEMKAKGIKIIQSKDIINEN